MNQTLARSVWPHENAIGKELQFGGMDGDLHPLHVIGVVADVRDESLDADPAPTVYVNYIQRPAHAVEFTVVLRAQGDRANLIAAMRRAATFTHPDVPLKFQTLEEVVGASLDKRRFTMLMIGIFAGAALTLATVGLYGVMAYITAQRTSEFGIRMALGAQRGDMLRLVLRHAFALAGLGVALGMFGAIASTRLLGSLLYGTGRFDIVTYPAVVLLLLLASLLASFLPARRAMQVDPVVALRQN